ncbi:MAG TPA: hypothetical protein VLX68_10680 [Chitinivibrionales bacterium]|nr:hypothetical protein [Chitinivibrionales bacterium]
METQVFPIDTQYNFSPFTYHLYADTVTWVYQYPPGGGTRASIIIKGNDSIFTGRTFYGTIVTSPGTLIDTSQIRLNYLDLAVETYAGIVHLPLTFNNVGGFIDTVLVDTSRTSGVILPASSRLFVTLVNLTPDTIPNMLDTTLQYPLDTILLTDPHAAGGQQ